MKKQFLTLIAVLATMLLSLTLAACGEKTVADVDSVRVLKMPSVYFEKGSEVDFSDGVLEVLYTDGTKRKVPMSDKDVTVRHAGTAVSGLAVGAEVIYKGAMVIVDYYVTDDLISSVEVSGKNMPARYAVGGKPRFKGVEIVVKYADKDKAAKRLWLTNNNTGKFDENYLKNKGVTLSGFSTEKVGEYTFSLRYLVSVFTYKYTVEKDDWVDRISLVDHDNCIDEKYLKGEKLNLNGAQMRLFYSKGDNKLVKITDDMVAGFDSSVVGNHTMSVKHPDCAESVDVDYTVVEPENIGLVIGREDFYNYVVGYNFGDFSEFKKSVKIDITKDDKKFKTVSGDDENIAFYAVVYDESDVEHKNPIKKELSEVVNSDLGRNFEIEVEYMDLYSATFILSIRKSMKETVLLDFDTIKSEYASGEEFDFGTARVRIIFDDGLQPVEVSLSEEYKKEKSKRAIAFIKTVNGRMEDVDKFDMSVGEHEEQFGLRVGGNVYDKDVPEKAHLGRYYFNYTVNPANPSPNN